MSIHLERPRTDHRSRYRGRAVLQILLSAALVGCADPSARSETGGSESNADPGPLAVAPIDTDFGLVWVDVRVGGSEPLPFLLDTGFEYSVIDAGVAADLGLSVSDPDTVPQPGGAVEIGMVTGVTVGIPGGDLENWTLRAIPIASAAGVVGRQVAGILGHDVLELRIWRIDYEASRLSVFDASYEMPPRGAELPVEAVAGEPFVDAYIVQPHRNEIRGRFKLDTGSTDVAGLNRNFHEGADVVAPGQRTVAMPGVAVGGETSGVLFRVDAFRIGPYSLERPVIGTTFESAGFETRDDAGTIGGELLRRFTLTIDYPHDRIFLHPNADYEEPVREDLSGVWPVARDPAFDSVFIRLVVPGSAAERAGLAANDEILAVDGVPASELRLRGVWEALRTDAGATRVLLVRRGDRTLEIPLQLTPMLQGYPGPVSADGGGG